MAHDLDFAMAQLRHAYKQLKAGTVKNQAEFADGLIAPQIKTLERFVGKQTDEEKD